MQAITARRPSVGFSHYKHIHRCSHKFFIPWQIYSSRLDSFGNDGAVKLAFDAFWADETFIYIHRPGSFLRILSCRLDRLTRCATSQDAPQARQRLTGLETSLAFSLTRVLQQPGYEGLNTHARWQEGLRAKTLPRIAQALQMQN